VWFGEVLFDRISLNLAKLKILHDEVVFNGKFIRALIRHFRTRHGNMQTWEMVKRKTYGRIVIIAAITPDGEIILEKNYRVPLKSYVIELPAGLIDKKGESEIDAARRELLEETGYVVDKMEMVVSGPFNAGLLDDEVAIFLGTNARKVKEPELEECEDIEVLKVPLKKLLDYLASLKGIKADVKIPAMLPYIQKRGLFK